MLEESPVGTVDTAAIERRQTTIVESVNALVVNSPESLLTGETMAVDIKAAIKTLHDELDPGIDKANKLHKHLTGQRKKYEDPLKAALGIAVGKTSAYRQEEERKRREEEARLRAEAMKQAEEERLAEAAKLEEVGRTTEAQAVLDEPVKPPPVSLPPTLEKPKGLSYSTTWEAEVVEISLVPRQYLMANMPMLNAMARSSKGQATIPGVKFRSKTGAARRS
jgi:hypothetical protein